MVSGVLGFTMHLQIVNNESSKLKYKSVPHGKHNEAMPQGLPIRIALGTTLSLPSSSQKYLLWLRHKKEYSINKCLDSKCHFPQCINKERLLHDINRET